MSTPLKDVMTPSLIRPLAKAAPVLLTAAILLVTVSSMSEFRQLDYWFELTYSSFSVAVLALALMPIIVTGGIDLSVGSVSVFSSVVVGFLWQQAGLPIWAAILGGIFAGLLAGIANGFLVTLGVIPLVATLATRELFRGLAFTVSGESAVSQFPAALNDFWREPILGLPLPLYGIALLFAATYFMVHHTWIGRMIYAIGDNETAARFAGVPVRGIKLGLYAWAGLAAGFCGAASVMEYGAAKADVDKSLELSAIACVVLGGVKITGGAGHVGGTLLGIVTLRTLLSGLLAVGANWRDTITGVLLITVAFVNEAAGRWNQYTSRQDAKPQRKHP